MGYEVGDIVGPMTITMRVNGRDHDTIRAEYDKTMQRYLADPDRDNPKKKNVYFKYRTTDGTFKPFIQDKPQTWLQMKCNTCGIFLWRLEYNIKNGHSQSCPICKQGSYKKNTSTNYVKGAPIAPKDDLRGQTFGHILITDEQPISDCRGHALYQGICLLCGKKMKNLRDDELRTHKKVCCNKCKTKRSQLEEAVAFYLQENHIEYEFTFDDLRGNHNGKLRYDFYIERNGQTYVIEANGKQHYEPVKKFGGKKGFKERVEHDNRKKEYAEEHGWIFIEIPYNYDNLDEYLSQVL